MFSSPAECLAGEIKLSNLFVQIVSVAEWHIFLENTPDKSFSILIFLSSLGQKGDSKLLGLPSLYQTSVKNTKKPLDLTSII